MGLRKYRKEEEGRGGEVYFSENNYYLIPLYKRKIYGKIDCFTSFRLILKS